MGRNYPRRYLRKTLLPFLRIADLAPPLGAQGTLFCPHLQRNRNPATRAPRVIPAAAVNCQVDCGSVQPPPSQFGENRRRLLRASAAKTAFSSFIRGLQLPWPADRGRSPATSWNSLDPLESVQSPQSEQTFATKTHRRFSSEAPVSAGGGRRGRQGRSKKLLRGTQPSPQSCHEEWGKPGEKDSVPCSLPLPCSLPCSPPLVLLNGR